MADRAGQAFAWPVPSDAGISTPVRFATLAESKRYEWLFNLSEEHAECTDFLLSPGSAWHIRLRVLLLARRCAMTNRTSTIVPFPAPSLRSRQPDFQADTPEAEAELHVSVLNDLLDQLASELEGKGELRHQLLASMMRGLLDDVVVMYRRALRG